MPSTPSVRRLDRHYIAMQVGFWAVFAAACIYQSYLLTERGFSDAQSGLLISIRCLSGILCQPLLGGFADRHPQIPLRRIVALSLGLSLAAALVFLLVPLGFGGTALVLVVMGGLELSSYPLMDSMAIQFINAGMPIRYSLGRGIGSMAYALCCAALGWQVGRLGVESTLVTHAALLALEILLVATFPPFQGAAEGARREGAPHSALWLLRRDPAFALMLLAILLGLTGCLPLSNFLLQVVTSRGGTEGDLGLVLFVMGAFELPTAFFFRRLYRRLGGGRLLLLSLFFCLAKAAALFVSGSLTGVLLAQPLQMLGYGLFTPTSVYYVNDSVPPEDQVKGQALMMVASNGLGGVLGSFFAGQTLERGGPNGMLLFCVLSCAAGVLVGAASLRLARRT
ncbi:MFS transporter [uncultured Intestinimonas sp.]|uniref:MFS transporter n=1 Tax=uncultured Intestinimonas sp. TaxID=1689265 RepID=UPI002625C424|nr:MFS transporter [uncultured Intestinimonas sp.]